MMMKLLYPGKQTSHHKNETIYSPLSGTTKLLSEMNDQAFSCMGKGVCIIPNKGEIIAPFDGVITTLFPTGHAVGITSAQGIEILIHIGSNTVEIEQGFFKKYKSQGDSIKQGEVLITYDLTELKNKGYDPETAVIILNSDNYLDIIGIYDQKVDYNDKLFVAVASEIK